MSLFTTNVATPLSQLSVPPIPLLSNGASFISLESISRPRLRSFTTATSFYTPPVTRPSDWSFTTATSFYTPPVTRPNDWSFTTATSFYTSPVTRPKDWSFTTATSFHTLTTAASPPVFTKSSNRLECPSLQSVIPIQTETQTLSNGQVFHGIGYQQPTSIPMPDCCGVCK